MSGLSVWLGPCFAAGIAAALAANALLRRFAQDEPPPAPCDPAWLPRTPMSALGAAPRVLDPWRVPA